MASSYTYTGDELQLYPQYLDAARGSTLVAEPGGTYSIAPVADTVSDGKGGVKPLMPAMPPDDRWTAAKAVKSSKESS